jgi:hypothetical protein
VADVTFPRAAVLATALAAATFGIAACASQVSGLMPAGGDDLETVRIAAIDVLLEHRYGILEAPTCTEVGDIVSCVGSITDGQVIRVRADMASEPAAMVVTIGSKQVYVGDVQTPLDTAAQDTS